MSKALLSTTILATSVFASPLWADLTADDAWAKFQETYTSYGAEVVTSDVSQADGTLTASDLVVRFAQPDFEFAVNVGDMSFAEQGDGTVRVEQPQDMTMVISGEMDGEPGEVTMSLRTEDFVTVLSGTPDDLSAAYSAASVTLSIDDVPDMPETAEFLFEMGMSSLTGSTRTTDAEGGARVQASAAVGGLSYDFMVKEPGEVDMQIGFEGSNLDVVTSYFMPEGISMADPAAAYANPDLRQDLKVTMGGSSLAFAFNDFESSGTGTLTATGGEVLGTLENGVFGYEGGAMGIQATVEASDLPVPLNFALSGYDYGFAMPMIKTDDARDFRVAIGLRDLELDPFLWNLFDPGEVLPRTPATVAFDISGLGRWFIDIMNPEEIEAAVLEVPGEVTEVTLSDLEVAAAGAELTGTGSFALDNTDLETFDGFPRPEGKIDLQLVGANGLLDKLVQMGLVPEDQVMGARMMMGLFAVPGQGEDTLNSTIEVNGEGHVLANGQRLR